MVLEDWTIWKVGQKYMEKFGM